MSTSATHNAIMEAGGKDSAPMLIVGSYVQCKSRIRRYIATRPNHDLINHCIDNGPYEFQMMDHPAKEATEIHPTQPTRRDRLGSMRIRGLCKQEEARIQLSTKQHDWVLDSMKCHSQDLEALSCYMAKIQEVIPAADEGTRPVFDKEPLEQVLTNDYYNVFAMENEHPEKLKSIKDTYVMEQCDSNTTPDSSDMSNKNGGEADQDELNVSRRS
ncbi:hypothetical protein Tco_1293289 [Tanacetum coccineum]